MIRALKCWWGTHCRPAGLAKAWCFLWVCERCSALVPGDLSKRKR